MQVGAFVALACVIVYAGRQYYFSLLRAAFFGARARDDPAAATACRIFLASSVLKELKACQWMKFAVPYARNFGDIGRP
jgi:hypothetical protein